MSCPRIASWSVTTVVWWVVPRRRPPEWLQAQVIVHCQPETLPPNQKKIRKIAQISSSFNRGWGGRNPLLSLDKSILFLNVFLLPLCGFPIISRFVSGIVRGAPPECACLESVKLCPAPMMYYGQDVNKVDWNILVSNWNCDDFLSAQRYHNQSIFNFVINHIVVDITYVDLYCLSKAQTFQMIYQSFCSIFTLILSSQNQVRTNPEVTLNASGSIQQRNSDNSYRDDQTHSHTHSLSIPITPISRSGIRAEYPHPHASARQNSSRC